MISMTGFLHVVNKTMLMWRAVFKRHHLFELICTRSGDFEKRDFTNVSELAEKCIRSSE